MSILTRILPCVRSALFVSTLATVVSLAAHGQSADRPHILVTNDDGIEAPGIVALASELAKIGDVTVFAPSENRSGSSMSLDIRNQISITPVMRDGVLFGYGVGTSPAGAALVGLEHEAEAGRPVDVVVSGINRGANVGDLGHFSGTVGAAMMAAYYGIPAVAVSADARHPDWDLAARFTAQFVEELLRRETQAGIVYSINVPAGVTRGDTAVAAPMGGSYFSLGFTVRTSDSAGSAVPRFGEPVVPAGSDTEHYNHGTVTVTPLHFDWTARDALRELASWNLAIP